MELDEGGLGEGKGLVCDELLLGGVYFMGWIWSMVRVLWSFCKQRTASLRSNGLSVG